MKHPTHDSAATRHPATPAFDAAGLWLGLLGVSIFALTLPMTRLAVGDATAPQLSPPFVTIGRAAGAGLLSLGWLWLTGGRVPSRTLWPALTVCAAGTVVGFPMGLALALREVPSAHAAVVTGVLPLATAAVAALWLRQRGSRGFWACAALGAALVVAFALGEGAGHLQRADAWLGVALASAAIGYVAGARASSVIGAQHAICWVLVLALPLTLPVAIALWPAAGASTAAWAGFAYVSVFSMWLGFFAWYRALAVGGVLRVSQLQLLQPFLALVFAVPLLGERLDARHLAFAAAVAGVVFLGRRLSAPAAPRAADTSPPDPR